MPTLIGILDAIWHAPNRPMAWGRIRSNHVVGADAAPFNANDDYLIVRLASMFLRNSRVLWLKLSPLAHATVSLPGQTAVHAETSVVGPAQFGDLSTAPVDRSIILNQKLAGPAVWRGGDLQIAAGLFAVPKDEAAGTLLDTLGQLSALAIPGLKASVEIARVVKGGVEGLIGLSGTKAVLGVKIALADPAIAAPGSEAAPCVLAAIAAPAASVNFDRLWVVEGRLWKGDSADALSPYEQYDHLIVTIERGPARQDWRGLPTLTPHEPSFDSILRTPALPKDTAVIKLNEAFVLFDVDLTAEPDLTDPDKARIRGEVIADLKARLSRKYGQPITLERTSPYMRSVGGIRREVDLEGFSFLDVGDVGPEKSKPIEPGTRPF